MNTGKLAWLCAVTRGRGHEVTSCEEAKAVISAARR